VGGANNEDSIISGCNRKDVEHDMIPDRLCCFTASNASGGCEPAGNLQGSCNV